MSEFEDPPEKLYKYRVLGERGSETRRFLRDSIVNSQVWFSTPGEFNDPLDCRFRVTFSGSAEERAAFLGRVSSQTFPNFSPQERKRWVTEAEAFGWLDKEERIKEVEDMILAGLGQLGVYSVSEVSDDILMWSYYADSHKGVCLCFSVSEGMFKDGEISFHPQRVRYQEEFPSLNPLRDEIGKQVVISLSTKARVWGHEAEWRYIDGRGAGLRKFLPATLSGIILGSRATEEDWAEVVSWVRESDSNPRLYQAEIEQGVYKIRISRVA